LNIVIDNQNFNKHFPNEQKKLSHKKINSFIAGAYLRNGYKVNDTIYKISINVSSKPEHCYTFLKKSKSTNVVFNEVSQETSEPNTMLNPTSTVYFNPSNELKEYFDTVKEIPNIKERIVARYSEIYLNDIPSQKRKKKRKEAEKKYVDFKIDMKKIFKKYDNEDIVIVEKLLNNK